MNRENVLGGALAVLVAGLLIAGCGAAGSAAAGAGTDAGSASTSSTDSSAGPSVTDSTDQTATDPGGTVLAGGYRASIVVGHDAVPQTGISLTFGGDQGADRLGVDAGCNGIGGTFTITDGQLIVSELIQTEMACEQPIMDQERWLIDFLTAGPDIAIDGDRIVLTGRGTVAESITLEQTVSDPTEPPLEDTRWLLETILVGGDAATDVPAGVEPAILIQDGRITFDAQCNSVGGEVTVEFDTLTVFEVIGTMMACEDSRGEMENLLTGTIRDTVNYSIADGRLTVTGAANSLVFVPAPMASNPATPSAPDVTVPESPAQADGVKVTDATELAQSGFWLLAGYQWTGQPAVVVAADEAAGLTFADGEVAVSGWCLPLRTGVNAAAGSLVAQVTATSAIGCSPPEDATGEALIEPLWADAGTTYGIDGDTLTITTADIVLTLVAGQR